VMDPFNGLTILGSSAIAVGSDAYSPYGPGMKGLEPVYNLLSRRTRKAR